MINLNDSLIILNDDVPCEELKKNFLRLLTPTIRVSNFLQKQLYRKYNNICLYSYKCYTFLLDLQHNILQKIYKCLNVNGVLKLYIYLNRNQTEKNAEGTVMEQIKKECSYNGFINVITEFSFSEKGIILNISAEKPNYDNDDEFNSDEDEVYNEEEDKKKVVNRVCENCTCGKKYGGKNIKDTMKDKEEYIMTDNVESSCGNCYLGDAFRCASCPYKGLPAFQPGDKVKLTLDDEYKNNV